MNDKSSISLSAEYYGYALLEPRYAKQFVMPWILLKLMKNEPSSTTLYFDNTKNCVNFTFEKKTISHQTKYILTVNHLPQAFSNIFVYLKLNGPLGVSPYEIYAFKLKSDVQVADIKYKLNENLLKDRKSGSIMDSLRRSKQSAGPINTLLRNHHAITEVLFVFRVVMTQRNIESSGLDDLLSKYFQMPSPGLHRNRVRTASASDSNQGDSADRRSRRLSDSSSSTNNSISESQAFTSLSSGQQSPSCEQTTPSSGHSSKSKQRVMLLDIGPASVALINPSDKKVIIEKFFLEVAHACKSTRFPDHFGIVFANDMDSSTTPDSSFVCYVFKSSSCKITTELYNSMVSAMVSYADNSRICDSCPLKLVNTLAKDLYDLLQMQDDVSEKQWKIEEVIRDCMLDLPSEILAEIETKMLSQKINSLDDKNINLFATIQEVMEKKQWIHANHQTKVLNKTPQSSAKIDLISRAKKTIASAFIFKGFNNLKKTETEDLVRSRSYTEPPDRPSSQKPIIQSLSQPADEDLKMVSTNENVETRPRSVTQPEDLTSSLLLPNDKAITPPENSAALVSPTRSNMRVSIVAPQPQSVSFDARRQTELASRSFSTTERRRARSGGVFDGLNQSLLSRDSIDILATRRKSTRAKIFKSVASASRRSTAHFAKEGISDVLENVADECSIPRKRTANELRAIWQRVTREIIHLIKTTKHKTVFCHNGQVKDSDQVFKISGYLTYGNVPQSVFNNWEALLNFSSDNSSQSTPNSDTISSLVKEGVPSGLRGQIWNYIINLQPTLMQSQKKRTSRKDQFDSDSMDEAMNENFQDLLQQLTCHQHAILIDVGRTFPQHAYFSLGSSGQISLYNVLKAYSLVDAEVGYCQGLTFVAGVLLLHTDEEECFYLFTQFMYKLGLRRLYTPDMHYLESCMYQWSRLLLDRLPKVHSILEEFDVMPSLYAPPWFLTFFSTQYPTWFVVRVFDLLILMGVDAIFCVALKLVEIKQDELEEVECLEDASDILKNQLPALTHEQLSACINQSFEMDLSSDLMSYSVEYEILQELDQEENINNNLFTRFQEIIRDLQEELDASSAVARSQSTELAQLRSKDHINSEKIEYLHNEVKEFVSLVNDMLLDIPEEKKVGYQSRLAKIQQYESI